MNCSGTVRLNPVGTVFVILVVFLIVYFNFGNNNGPILAYHSVSLKSLLVASIDIAKRGGQEVKKIREQVDIGEQSKGKTLEGANNPVTDGDLKSHRAMFYGLKKTFPGLDIISEEHDSVEMDMSKIELVPTSDTEIDEEIPDSDNIILPANEVSVWIDPLDATQEYTENLLQYVTTMVCVAVRGKPTLGIIYKPFSDEIFWGWWGPNHVSKSLQAKRETTPDMKIIVSRSHAGKVESVAHDAFGSDVTVTPAGGAGYKVLEVVSGKQDAYIHVTLIKKWDLCAGNAILNAVGGNMSNLKGENIDYSSGPQLDVKNQGGVLATVNKHKELLKKLENLNLE